MKENQPAESGIYSRRRHESDIRGSVKWAVRYCRDTKSLARLISDISDAYEPEAADRQRVNTTLTLSQYEYQRKHDTESGLRGGEAEGFADYNVPKYNISEGKTHSVRREKSELKTKQHIFSSNLQCQLI